MSSDNPTFSEQGEENIRERYGSIRCIKDMGEREDDNNNVLQN